jgi:hypothetical protein
MSVETNTAQIPQSQASLTTDDLELKSVGNGNFVGTYHRNAYGLAPRKET